MADDERNSCKYLQSRFDKARKILNRLTDTGVCVGEALTTFGALEFDFNMCLSVCTSSSDSVSELAAASQQCQRAIAAENYPQRLDRIIEDLLSKSGGSVVVQTLLHSYYIVPPAMTGPDSCSGFGMLAIDHSNCENCGSAFDVDADRSELTCIRCGAVCELHGAIFDEIQMYSQESHRAKPGQFSPNRHFKFWMTHILASESAEEIGTKPDDIYGEKMLASLRAIIAQERMILRHLTVYDVRKMLKMINRSSLNKNVSLILLRLTGIGPPQIAKYYDRLEKLFASIIEIRERIRGPIPSNRSFYCYYISKTLERIIPESDVEARRILFYIYMQGEATLRKSDAEWSSICPQLPDDITFCNTERYDNLKYMPK